MKKVLLIVFVITLNISVFAQKDIGFRAGLLVRDISGFNFFTGKDAQKFRTTPKAFGSGVFDFSGQYNVINKWIFNPVKAPIGVSLSLGLKIVKYRFTENYFFGTDTFALFVDNASNHFYNKSFFSRHGTKLVKGSLFVPLMVYFPIQNWFNSSKDNFGIYGGVFYGLRLFTYNKKYYKDNNALIKYKQTNSLIKNYFNNTEIGTRIGVKIYNFFIFGQYIFTPFFKNVLNYDIHETKIGINYHINYKKVFNLDKEKIDIIDDGFGTDAK